MVDQDLRDRLIAYVADEPPRTLTAETVLRAGRRARRLHRFGVASAAAALLTGAVLIPSVVFRTEAPEPDGSLSAAEACAAATAATPPPAPRSSGPSYDPAPGDRVLTPAEIDRTAARLGCVVIDLVTQRLGGFAFYPAEQTWLPPGLGPLQFAVEGAGPAFVATAIVESRDGVGSIGFTVSRRPYVASPFGYQQALFCPGPLCTQRTGPRGERVDVIVWEGQNFVQVYFGQTVVNAVALPYDIRYEGHAAPRAGEAGIAAVHRAPLSVEELVAIATDPRLDVFAHE